MYKKYVLIIELHFFLTQNNKIYQDEILII